MGFFGILEDKALPHVPGTVILNEELAQSESITAALRHGKGRNAHVVLAPQPSEDPNDPLNWSSAKKLVIISVLGLGVMLSASAVSGLLNAALFNLATELNVPFGDITIISGYQLLVAGATGPFFSALGRKYGKRPAFVLSTIMSLLGSIVGSTTRSYSGLLAARIIQGFGIAAYESLVISVIGDLYFVHQRGMYMSIIQFLLGAISNFAGVVCGAVTTKLGWPYLFHLLDAAIGFQLLLLVFFCPETAYIRDQRYNTDAIARDDLKGLSVVEQRYTEHVERTKEGSSTPIEASETHASTAISVRQKKTLFQEMAIFTGTYSDENFLQLVIAPFAVCMNVAVLWIVVISGGLTAFCVAQAFVLAQVFSVPPYNLNAAGVGCLSLGPFAGGVVASLFLGIVLDPLIKWFSAKNKGIYEPEYRLVIMFGALLSGGGLIGWGSMLENEIGVYACATVHGVVLFGVTCAAISTAAYGLDSYRDMSNEIFIAAMVFKNFLFYGFSYFVNNWTAVKGTGEVFGVFGGVALAMTLTTIPMFIFGKR